MKQKSEDDIPISCQSPAAALFIMAVMFAVVFIGGFVAGQISPELISLPTVNEHEAYADMAVAPNLANTGEQTARAAWVVRCSPQKTANNLRACEMAQSLSIRENGARLAEMALALIYDMRDNGTVIDQLGGVAVLPTGLNRDEGLLIRLDDEERAQRFSIDGCSESGCIARVVFSRGQVEAISKGKTLSLYVISENGQQVAIPLTLAGFSDTYAKLREETFKTNNDN